MRPTTYSSSSPTPSATNVPTCRNALSRSLASMWAGLPPPPSPSWSPPPLPWHRRCAAGPGRSSGRRLSRPATTVVSARRSWRRTLGSWPAPPATVGLLAETCASLIEALHDPVLLESVLAGFARLRHPDRPAFDAAMAPVRHRLTPGAVNPDSFSAINIELFATSPQAKLLRMVLLEPPPPPAKRRGLRGLFARSRHVYVHALPNPPLSPTGVSVQRMREVAARILAGESGDLVAVPTEATGLIDPAVLIARVSLFWRPRAVSRGRPTSSRRCCGCRGPSSPPSWSKRTGSRRRRGLPWPPGCAAVTRTRFPGRWWTAWCRGTGGCGRRTRRATSRWSPWTVRCSTPLHRQPGAGPAGPAPAGRPADPGRGRPRHGAWPTTLPHTLRWWLRTHSWCCATCLSRPVSPLVATCSPRSPAWTGRTVPRSGWLSPMR